jgi:DNA-directed RNA polymerase subunit F
MAESAEYIQKDETGETDVKGFVKKFVKLKPKEAKEARKKLEGLEILQLRADHISKIIDMVPETNEELNKVCNDISLSEDETNKILDAVKSFK